MQKIEKKRCYKCKTNKDYSQFYKCKSRKDGFDDICKKCSKKKNEIRREKYSHRCIDEIQIPEKKKCYKCKIQKSSKEFYKDKNQKCGLNSRCKSCCRMHFKEFRKKSEAYRLGCSIRWRLRGVLKRIGVAKSDKIISLLGCSLKFFREHIERQFKEGMTWENRSLWHIDHIKPLASFDLKNPEHQKQATHYTNLQPLWAKDNLTKGAKWHG